MSARNQPGLRGDIHRHQIILDRLGKGAVVLDQFGHAWQYGGVYWYRSFGDDSSVSSFEVAQRGPFRVLVKESPC